MSKSIAIIVLFSVMAVASLSGCATIANGPDQTVKFSYLDQPNSTVPLTVGTIRYTSDDNVGDCQIPGSVNLERTNKPLNLVIDFTDDTGAKKTIHYKIPSTETGWMAGNAGIAVASLGLGAIGLLVDAVTNNSREYPDSFLVDRSTGLVVLRYEDDKNYYTFDQQTGKFTTTDSRGHPIQKKSGDKADR